MTTETALRLIVDEFARATAEFGPFASPHEGYAILQEEADELWEEVKSGRAATHRGASEATQVAAMAMRFLVDVCSEKDAKMHEHKVAGTGPFARPERLVGGYSG